MSSKLKLSGQTARVILQGNDTISSDQTFTFPDTGGEVALNGNIPTVPGGQIVGYQQGLWLADVKGSTGVSVWIEDGVPNGDNAEPWSSFTWNRIGQTVSISVCFGAKDVGGASDTSLLVMTNLPYISKEGSQSAGGKAYSALENCTTYNFAKSTSSYTNVSATVSNLSGQSSNQYNGQTVYFLWNGLNFGWDTVKANQISSTCQIYFTLQYQTDDTTWTPINGATVL
jgi:hypothetical protein